MHSEILYKCVFVYIPQVFIIIIIINIIMSLNMLS